MIVAHRVAVLLCVALQRACAPAPAKPITPAAEARLAATRAAPTGAPVLLELFTSQGCSSCPPADRVVSELARTGSLGGRPVIALAYHVDIWDGLGWADPFGDAQFTARHDAYAARLADGRSYTPQAVVGGRAHRVGGDVGGLRALVTAAPAVAALAVTARWDAGTLEVEGQAPADAALWVAVWEDGVATTILRGENAGAEVVEDRIVRRLVLVAAAGRAGATTIELAPSWRALGAVAFGQRGDAGPVLATQLLPPRPR